MAEKEIALNRYTFIRYNAAALQGSIFLLRKYGVDNKETHDDEYWDKVYEIYTEPSFQLNENREGFFYDSKREEEIMGPDNSSLEKKKKRQRKRREKNPLRRWIYEYRRYNPQLGTSVRKDEVYAKTYKEAAPVIKSQEVLANEVLDVMRERHPSIIHGAGSGRDGDDIYLSFTLENPNFELEEEEIERYNEEVAAKWAGIVHDDDRWILEVSLDKLSLEEGQDAGPLVMAIAEEAANACQWLDEKYCEGTRSWGAPIDRGRN